MSSDSVGPSEASLSHGTEMENRPLTSVVAPLMSISSKISSPSPPRKSSFSFLKRKKSRSSIASAEASSSGKIGKEEPPPLPERAQTLSASFPQSQIVTSETSKEPRPTGDATGSPAENFASKSENTQNDGPVLANADSITGSSDQRDLLQEDPTSRNDPQPSTGTSNSAKISEAFMVAHTTKELSNGEKKFDKLGAGVAKGSEALEKLNAFYSANASTLSFLTNIVSSGALEQALGSLDKVANVVCTGLDALSGVHPFVGIACQAFKGVIKVNLQRIENNKNCGLVIIQMQNLMKTLFRLREIKDSEEKGPDGKTIKGQMQDLIERMTKSIKKAGSDINAYISKGVISKTLKCMDYRNILNDHATGFEKLKKDLMDALTMHIALGVESANKKLDEQGSNIKEMKATLDKLLVTLVSPRERSMIQFVDNNGGGDSVVKDPSTLQRLFDQSGESFGDYDKRGTIKDAQKTLSKELQENLKVELDKKFEQFEKRLELVIQSLPKQMENVVQDTVTNWGAHNKILDPDLKAIWKSQAWKGNSVKARYFILALHDHFADKVENEKNFLEPPDVDRAVESNSSKTEGAKDVNESVGETTNNASRDNLLDSTSNVKGPNFSDPMEARRLNRWALSFLDVSHVQNILEAIDDDGTGFISVKEVNQFVSSRPEGWSLPYWLAFWAVGWHASITIYRSRILAHLKDMFTIMPSFLPSNWYDADVYLRSWDIMKIDEILRSIHILDDNSLATNGDLKLMLDTYMKSEEQRLEASLTTMNFYIEEHQTVSLITGPGRIERYLLPLIYVVLRQHRQVVGAACKYRLQPDEFQNMTTTLSSIIETARFKVLYENDWNLKYGDTLIPRYDPLGYNYLEYWDAIYNTESSDSDSDSGIGTSKKSDEKDSTSLFYGLQTCYDGYDERPKTEESVSGHNESYDKVNRFLVGTWSGDCLYLRDGDYTSSQGPMEMFLCTSGWYDGREHWAQSWSGIMDVEISSSNLSSDSADVQLTFNYYNSREGYDDYTIICTGKADFSRDTITGTWIALDYYDVAKEHEGFLSGIKDSPVESSFNAGDANSNGVLSAAGADAVASELAEAEVVIEGEAEDEKERAVADLSLHYKILESAPRAFRFTRTPASVHRYRYSDKAFKENAPKARWNFALNAVQHQVQTSRLKRSCVMEKFSERRRFVAGAWTAMLKMRDPKFEEAHSGLSIEEIRDLLCRLPPVDGRFYRTLAATAAEQVARNRTVGCDACGCLVVRERFCCVECLGEGGNDIVDLCVNCLDQPVDLPARGFKHSPSHCLVTWRKPLMHQMYNSIIVKEALEVVESARKRFGSKSTDANNAGEGQLVSVTSQETARCSRCDDSIHLMFWVCADCVEDDSYLCQECFMSTVKSLSLGTAPPHHAEAHCMVRVNLEEKIVEEDKLDALEKRLEKRLVDAFEGRISALEEKIGVMHTLLERIGKSVEVSKGA